ncbi:TetR/AcrR family transcriptional regulator [Photobacterium chitinilyticum]|uniref:TetR/AcrR family transcriptional regulator n=1 Tax=Photobacterium chitinilyticum TaxID=2485123 RepID=A0A3S3T070_9GAMM|nr:TetR/AcrR family transcriptional regulator [Photobacterium chitinilyticum]RWX56038.1 TetR/AcrR family transcriptional regulator [Photobacterium chitinilyticum]
MRSAEFDREHVLRAAMAAFIAKGYSKTSMQDLKKATGLHPGSIYCAFDNKRGLLLAALEQYRSDRQAEFMALFDGEVSSLDALKRYLDSVVDECEREEIKDCLLQKALTELTKQDDEVENVITQMLNQWEEAIAAKIQQAQQDNELSSERDHHQLAQFLVMGIYGIRTFSHTQPSEGTLQSLADQLFEHICT